MQNNYITTKTISFFNQKILSKEENKIKFLESRLSGPNNEGRTPVEYTPLKETEIENIKTKMLILPPVQLFENFSKKRNYSTSRKKRNITEVKIEMFLNKKRKYSASKEICSKGNKDLDSNNNFNINNNKSNLSIISNKSSNIKNTKDENDSSFFAKNIYFNNNLFKSRNYKNKSKLKFDKNNTIKKNNNNFKENSNSKYSNNSLKTKTIYDYYKTTSIKRSYEYTNSNSKITSNNNDINTQINKKINYINNNEEKLLKKLEEQNLIIKQKEKEISTLKLTQKKNEQIISNLIKSKNNNDTEIRRCRHDISNMIKEISNLKRENKKKWLNEQQYHIGKISYTHNLNYKKGQVIEYWEDGKDLKEINKKLEKIKEEKEEIQKQKGEKNNSRNNLISFKLNILEKEENEIFQKLNNIEKRKITYIQEQNLFNQEAKCTFAPQKKEGLPLLSGRYQIIGLLGKGGYSEVYKAYDLENHVFVACKLHQLNQNWKEEIKKNYIKHTIRENQIHKNINHPNIVKLYDTIEVDDNSFCTILEFCSGPDLSTYIKKNQFISEKNSKIIIHQILEGLIYLNKLPNKIIHYDLKPENIIFNNFEVKITDFGLSKIIDTNSDKIQLTSQGVGTYWYLPPECFEEKKNIEISSKVDIWSCGVILYEMIYNKKPFGNNFSQDRLIKEKIIQNAKIVEFPEKPFISKDCKNFIRHCLAFNQDDRYDVFQAMKSKFLQKNY